MSMWNRLAGNIGYRWKQNGRAAENVVPAELMRLAGRPLRLAASDMRGPALALLGHAQHLVAEAAGGEHARAVAAIAEQFLELADDLEDQATPTDECRTLAAEPVALAALVEDVVAAVGALLVPGGRHFRIAPSLAGIGLAADRRALSLILSRVFTRAARSTRDGDWIDVGAERHSGVFALVVADEGASLARLPARAADRRGLGLGLALARSLMEAHGGTLSLESLPRVGTRVTLRFPAERLLAAA